MSGPSSAPGPDRPTVFISVANDEFAQLRADLRDTLAGTFDVVVQPDFHASAADTIGKLDAAIAPCDLLVHLVGESPGSIANPDAVAEFFRRTPRETFLTNHERARDRLGGFDQITYVNWEPWLALNRDKPVLLFAVAGHEKPDFPQRDHLDNLYQARKHPDTLREEHLRLGQITAAIFHHFGLPEPAPRQLLAEPRFLHHAAEHFLGREEELAMLDRAWENRDSANLISIIAWGGVGKTALLAHWISSRFVDKNWQTPEGDPNPGRYFDWSFYEQGTVSSSGDSDESGEDPDSDSDTGARSGSAGDFFVQALEFFGDPDPNRPGQGARLARLVQRAPALLILDGLEPLQYPFSHDQAGRLLNPDMADLLTALASRNPGLCVVTSRQRLSDLHALTAGKAPERLLDDLPIDIAVRHLQKQLARDLEREPPNAEADLREACVEYGRHALSLTLLGHFLNVAFGGDIRRRDCVDLQTADRETRPDRRRNAWKVLEVYEGWLAGGGGRAEDLAVLRLTGLFDRPARPDCLAALRRAPAIPGLTDVLVELGDAAWSTGLRRLSAAGLITLRRPAEDSSTENSAFPVPHSEFQVDAHPLIREYFDHQLSRRLPEAYREAHGRLFDHLCESAEQLPDDLPGLQPLYQAVRHGCLAGRQEEARAEVYRDRIQRGAEFFSTHKLGAIGSNLGAVAAFFEEPWRRLLPNLRESDQDWLLTEAAFCLRALGRLTEAMEPMQKSAESGMRNAEGHVAVIRYSNLSELEATLGRLGEAVEDGRRAIGFADRSGDAFWRMGARTTAADALYQRGERAEARALAEEAERLQAEREPAYPLLYSLWGFRYVDLLLAEAERAAWRRILECGGLTPLWIADGTLNGRSGAETAENVNPESQSAVKPAYSENALAACAEAQHRASQMLESIPDWYSLLSIALDHLSLARAGLYRSILNPSAFRLPHSEMEAALSGLRQAGAMNHLPKALLTASLNAEWGILNEECDDEESDSAFRTPSSAFLDEAEEIARRGPMPLYLADVHLHRARLFRDRDELAKARVLIEKHGYGRRKEELEDAEEAARLWE